MFYADIIYIDIKSIFEEKKFYIPIEIVEARGRGIEGAYFRFQFFACIFANFKIMI